MSAHLLMMRMVANQRMTLTCENIMKLDVSISTFPVCIIHILWK